MNLGNYYSHKSVKLQDSYIVTIHNLKQRHFLNHQNGVKEDTVWDENGNIGEIFGDPDDHLIELFTCIAVELPSYKYKIEKHQTGNTYHKIVLPDYSANPTFSLTLAETDMYDIDELLKFIIRRNVKHAGLDDMEYVDNGWVDVITVDVLNNDLNKKVLRYQFGFCRLVDYSIYDLSYNTNDLPTYKLTFAFESYKKIYEPDVAADGYDPNSIFEETRNRYRFMSDEYNTIADRKDRKVVKGSKESGFKKDLVKTELAKTEQAKTEEAEKPKTTKKKSKKKAKKGK